MNRLTKTRRSLWENRLNQTADSHNARAKGRSEDYTRATGTGVITEYRPYREGTLYVKVDETGSPGRRTRGQTHYIVGACLVPDEQAFADVTQSRYTGYELKFHDTPYLRDTVLREAAPLVDTVFSVAFSKRRERWNPSNGKNGEVDDGQKKKLHVSLLNSLANGISKIVRADYLDVVVDANTIVSKREVQRIFGDNLNEVGIKHFVETKPSWQDFSLQTNDFFIGSIGYYFNRPNSVEKSYVRNRLEDSMRPPNERTRGYYIAYFEDELVNIPFRWL